MTKEIAKKESIKLTGMVKRLIFDIPKYELAEKLGISRPTLDRRIIDHNWTYIEYLILNKEFSNHNIK